MSEDEQEVLQRLVETSDLRVVINGWGHIDAPAVIVGDARIAVVLDLTFSKPAVPIPVRFFDLELQTGAGLCLYKNRELLKGGEPMLVGAGLHLVFAWDVMIHHMDPKLVKMLKPGAIGLTSRRLDRDTGEATLTGNMDVTPHQKKLLGHIKEGENKVKQIAKAEVIEATKKSGHKIKQTKDGLRAQNVLDV
jgi:hypothetical protein